VRELVVASDSRLSGGESWDTCPKIFHLNRQDAVLAFAGATTRAYPFVLQALNVVASTRNTANGSVDLRHLAKKIQKMANSMLKQFSSFPMDDDHAGCELLLAGWSWQHQRFETHVIDAASPPGPGQKFRLTSRFARGDEGVWEIIGDKKSDLRRRISGLLESEPDQFVSEVALTDWTPLTALSDLCLKSNKHDTVGGTPQMFKVHRQPRVEQFAVTVNGTVAIGGRPLMEGERHDLRTIKRRPSEPGQPVIWRVCE